ncbi:MAG: hypothetical protein V7K67_31595 [Nostoc sp.]|uniref:hypothetical protein n=1 Tax=Nostoc sp. TaxID=1180 RepID=UPI002FFAF79A
MRNAGLLFAYPVVDIAPTLQGKTQLQQNPYPPQSLAWATWIMQGLGGCSGYKEVWQRSHGKIVVTAWAYYKVPSPSESAFEFCVKNF